MINEINFLDLRKQYKSIKKEINVAIKRVLDSGFFIGGKEVKDFETAVAKYCGVKYAIGLNSGTDSLFFSLKALGVDSGDEVITTPFTFIPPAEIIANCGAKPVFVDINPDTFNIDPLKIEEKITKKTKAIIPVHLFGQAADMEKIMKIAKKYKLRIIEDAAQALSSRYKNKKVGSFGDLGCFSFFPTKNLGGYGDGGIVVTNNKKLADKILLLRNHGSSKKDKYKNLILGTNSRLDAIQAAVLNVKLKHLNSWNKKRKENAEYYNKTFEGVEGITTPVTMPNRTHIFHQYTIRTKYRGNLRKYLKKQRIPTMVYYPLPLHLQSVFKYLGHKKDDFPKAEKVAKEVLSLPIYPELRRKDQDRVIKKIKEFYKKI